MDRKILGLAIPNIVSNLSIPMLSAVDAALMGHLPGASAYLSAIAIATGIFNFIYWGFGFLRMGTTGLTAQAYGAGDQRETMLILGRGMLVALGGSLLVVVFQGPIAQAGFWFMDPAPEAGVIAREYFDIRIYAAPATLSLYALHGWFLGRQNAVFPMVLSIVANLANLGFNLWFVQGLGMAAEGIAWGTVIAQYLSVVVAIVYWLIRYRGLLDHLDLQLLIQTRALVRFFLVNGDIMVRTICLVVVFNYFVAASGDMGLQVQAGNSLLLQMLFVMSYLVDGFAFTAESLVGKFVGAGDGANLRLAIRRIFLWSVGIAGLFSLAYWLGGPAILGLFTDDLEVLQVAYIYLPWMIAMPLVAAFSFIWDGIYLGATASAAMRNSMLISTAAFFLVWWLCAGGLENHGLWLAMTIFMGMRGVTLGLFAKKQKFFKLV
jgi:MATE family multidrug resistance protein